MWTEIETIPRLAAARLWDLDILSFEISTCGEKHTAQWRYLGSCAADAVDERLDVMSESAPPESKPHSSQRVSLIQTQKHATQNCLLSTRPWVADLAEIYLFQRSGMWHQWNVVSGTLVQCRQAWAGWQRWPEEYPPFHLFSRCAPRREFWAWLPQKQPVSRVRALAFWHSAKEQVFRKKFCASGKQKRCDSGTIHWSRMDNWG